MAFVDFPKGSLLPKWSITFVWPCVRAEVGLKAAVCVGGGASDRSWLGWYVCKKIVTINVYFEIGLAKNSVVNS